jgi:hypothetical protein
LAPWYFIDREVHVDDEKIMELQMSIHAPLACGYDPAKVSNSLKKGWLKDFQLSFV